METPKEPWNFCETPEEKCTMNYCDDNGCQNRKRNSVSESIFSGKTTIIPMADVQHIEKLWYTSDEKTRDNYRGIKVITKHTRWDIEADSWSNNIYLDRQEGDDFLKAWCIYRNELEIESLIKKT